MRRPDKLLPPIRLALLAGLLPALPCSADLEGYAGRIVQIADESYINRDPVVGETGLVAWQGYKEGLAEDGGGTEIFVFRNGKTQKVFDRALHPEAAHMRPQVWMDTVIWHTTRSSTMSGGVTWVLREVPDAQRDIGPDGKPLPELPAWYAEINLAEMQGEASTVDFNLVPSKQGLSGPFTNVFEYSVAYLEGNTATNAAEVIEAARDPERLRQIVENPRQAPWFMDATNAARRRTIDFNELARWTEDGGVEWLTYNHRNDLAPSFDGDLVAWQTAKAFPFGWEIMAMDAGKRYQLTTNYYYDMAPKVSKRDVVWYGWDGNDFEIFHWNADTLKITQLTSNTWDDVSPSIHDGVIAWESYPSVNPEIFAAILEHEGKRLVRPVIKQLSSNLYDDINPVVHNGVVAWQSFDGSDYEIRAVDLRRGPPDATGLPVGELIFSTDNEYDDILPDLRDGLLVWMGYTDDEEGEAGWDAEIFAYDVRLGPQGRPVQLTRNDYEDKNPRTAGGHIVWQADVIGGSRILLAPPPPAPNP
jgi:hypothetical protein